MRQLSKRTNTLRRSTQAGMSLVETVIALAILLIAAAGLTGLSAVAIVTTENQGHLAARSAEYAQDKLEQLMSLKYGDAVTDTISPACIFYLVTANCSNPAAGEVGLSIGGSLNFNAPTLHYVDYLDFEGNPMGGGNAPPAGWFYQRVWLIEDSTSPGSGLPVNLKRITVACRVRSSVGSRGRLPQATVSSLKSNPF